MNGAEGNNKTRLVNSDRERGGSYALNSNVANFLMIHHQRVGMSAKGLGMQRGIIIGKLQLNYLRCLKIFK